MIEFFNRRRVVRACLALAGVGALSGAPIAQAFDASSIDPIAAQGTLQAAFSPWDDIETLIITTIDGAKKQILVQTYLLTSKKIADALIAAQQRGVSVLVLLDAEQSAKVPSSKAHDLSQAGVPVWLETQYQNAHNKVIVIDAGTASATVITGSYNFTWSAQHKNAENILIARKNPLLAARYAQNWERHRQGAVSYK
ncbi:phospholipase D family protein [Herminiimonas sp. CN]|uniref:phospholipase D family nuclease n=1 Tax=Herminiimonas sp. CN TaxID=1349818 RepID=UPI0004738CBD|nr:phospholipase D family protein [Herminiimonas sp. CN]